MNFGTILFCIIAIVFGYCAVFHTDKLLKFYIRWLDWQHEWIPFPYDDINKDFLVEFYPLHIWLFRIIGIFFTYMAIHELYPLISQ